MSRVAAYLAQIEEKKRRRRGVQRASWALLAVAIAIMLVCWSVGERIVPGMILVNLGYIPLVLTAIGFLVWAIFKFNRLAVLVNVVTLLACGWFWFRPVLFSFGKTPSSPVLRVMTYNIQDNLVEEGQGLRLTNTLKEADPDILLIQEAGMLMHDPVRRQTFEKYNVWFTENIAIIVKPNVCKILQLKNIDFGTDTHFVAQIALIEWNKKRFYVVNTHLQPWNWTSEPKSTFEQPGVWAHAVNEKDRQMKRLAKEILALKGPVIFGGDFNLRPNGALHAELCQLGNDSFRAAGRGIGGTWGNDRLDYLFATPHWNAIEARVIDSDASDHRPLLTKFELLKAENKLVKAWPDPDGDDVIDDNTYLEKRERQKAAKKRKESGISEPEPDPIEMDPVAESKPHKPEPKPETKPEPKPVAKTDVSNWKPVFIKPWGARPGSK